MWGEIEDNAYVILHCGRTACFRTILKYRKFYEENTIKVIVNFNNSLIPVISETTCSEYEENFRGM